MSTLPNIPAIWGTLSLQVTPANLIIALSRTMVTSWNPSEVAFILRAYHDHTGQSGILVQDPAMANRVFLRPMTNDILRTIVPVPQNPPQSGTVPPHVILQRPVDLPQETLLHIVHGRSVPRRAIAQTLIRRPLNSWMAYRSYYSPIFTDLLQMQKNTSTYLKRMWSHEPFKAKWAVIARAYSRIRNLLGSTSTPLRTFLALVCPEMGMIGVHEYLDKLGWAVNVTEDGSLNLQYTPLSAQASYTLAVMHTTSMTDQDIINFCGQRGYISPQNAALATQGRRGIAKTKRAKMAKILSPQSVLASTPQLVDPAYIPESAYPGQHPVETVNNNWPGSSSDVHTTFTDSLDLTEFAALSGETSSSVSWHRTMDLDPVDIDDPFALDTMLEGFGAESLSPSIPDGVQYDEVENWAFM